MINVESLMEIQMPVELQQSWNLVESAYKHIAEFIYLLTPACAILAFVFKKYIAEKIQAHYKQSIERQLNTQKGEIAKEIESMKLEHAASIEALKWGLGTRKFFLETIISKRLAAYEQLLPLIDRIPVHTKAFHSNEYTALITPDQKQELNRKIYEIHTKISECSETYALYIPVVVMKSISELSVVISKTMISGEFDGAKLDGAYIGLRTLMLKEILNVSDFDPDHNVNKTR